MISRIKYLIWLSITTLSNKVSYFYIYSQRCNCDDDKDYRDDDKDL